MTEVILQYFISNIKKKFFLSKMASTEPNDFLKKGFFLIKKKKFFFLIKMEDVKCGKRNKKVV